MIQNAMKYLGKITIVSKTVGVIKSLKYFVRWIWKTNLFLKWKIGGQFRWVPQNVVKPKVGLSLFGNFNSTNDITSILLYTNTVIWYFDWTYNYCKHYKFCLEYYKNVSFLTYSSLFLEARHTLLSRTLLWFNNIHMQMCDRFYRT